MGKIHKDSQTIRQRTGVPRGLLPVNALLSRLIGMVEAMKFT